MPLQSASALSFDDLQGLTYLQVKGTGLANTCPTIDAGSIVCAAEEPLASDVSPSINLEELDGRSTEAFYAALGERGPDTLNAIICYTAKCLPCKATKPLMKEWEEALTAEGKAVRFWQFGLTLPNKDVALGLGVNSSPRFLCIRDGEVLCHMRGKAAVDDFKAFVFSHC